MQKKDKQNVTFRIENAENGVVCTVCYGYDSSHEDKRYIYPDIEKLAKELPGLFSVAEVEAPEETEESLENMKKSINKGKEY